MNSVPSANSMSEPSTSSSDGRQSAETLFLARAAIVSPTITRSLLGSARPSTIVNRLTLTIVGTAFGLPMCGVYAT
jgi:hypothetical protein